MQALADLAFTAPVVERARTLRAVSVRALTDDESVRVVEKLREIVSREGDQSKAARKLKVSQQTVSKTLAPGATVGMMLARAVARYFGTTFDVLVGTVADDVESLSPIDQVRATQLYRHASTSVRKRFDELASYTRTPEGGAAPNALWFTKRLVALLEDEREGLLGGPPGAEPEPIPESRPTPPRKAKPRRA